MDWNFGDQSKGLVCITVWDSVGDAEKKNTINLAATITSHNRSYFNYLIISKLCKKIRLLRQQAFSQLRNDAVVYPDGLFFIKSSS